MDKRHKGSQNYDEYILAMKRVHRGLSLRTSLPEMLTPRERHRQKSMVEEEINAQLETDGAGSFQNVNRIGVIASMVPDEIINKHHDFSIRNYETALMFIDVSGFTDLCENYTFGHGGPSRLTQVLNSYIGAMVQEILTHNGDVLKFSGDAFLSMWKKTQSLTMQDVVHMAIDCGLIIQKNYGTYVTDVGLVLKVKIAISAGMSYFSILGGSSSSQCSYVIVGQPVWDVKMAEYLSTAGDVLTSASAWMYVNEAEYCTQPYGDGRHTKVLGVGATWKRVETLHSNTRFSKEHLPNIGKAFGEKDHEESFREYSLRPALVTAIRSSWWPGLRRFMLSPVLRAVDNDEPLEFLTEIRRVVVVFFNIITKTVTENTLINIVNNAYKCICSISSESGGLVNKVSMFDKDMMFLVVFGLRGLKHEDETQKALECALQCKKTLDDDNIITISIGVTSGTTYCGIVGHNLRREYTIIGPAVNKAARLMMAYPDKVSCDKETFLRSKLDQESFKLLGTKPLKGISKPGPIYEFNKIGWRQRAVNWRHPLLGRTEELLKYNAMLNNAIEQNQRSFTRYKEHKFAIAFLGPRLIGKTRLIEECLISTPSHLRVEKMILTENIQVPYGLFRCIISKTFKMNMASSMRRPETRDVRENIIRTSVDLTSATPIQIYAINTIFDCRFPLPEKFRCSEDFLSDVNVKKVVFSICKNNFTNFMVLVIEEAQYSDVESWRLILLLLYGKFIFMVMSFTEEELRSPAAIKVLMNPMIVKVNLKGIDRCYHAAIACQLLDVQAIPADLEKIIESASAGLPGWIQNFVISLVQRGALTVETVRRCDAATAGLIMPSPALLQWTTREHAEDTATTKSTPSYNSIYSIPSTTAENTTVSESTNEGRDIIQMAVVASNYNFDDMAVDMSMDVVILKTYDALTPFEKMLLKCASVLGDVFSRRMLLHLLQSDCQRSVAQAVAKLFAIRVLECEGGDFTRDTSIVLVHPAPAMHGVKPPYCACLGTRQPVNCRDLPLYAFCGYMKFKHSLFRTTTYELLTENQKTEMHARALMFLERYTRRCAACGSGCFTKLLGTECRDGLIEESEELKRTREQICAISAETKVPRQLEPFSPFEQDTMMDLQTYKVDSQTSYEVLDPDMSANIKTDKIAQANRRYKRVRTFSSLQLDNCECLSILLSVYYQFIDHCHGAGEYQKLYEAYVEYADLSVLHLNIPQAVRLLYEVENIVKTNPFYTSKYFRPWMIDYLLARIHSLRGMCMLESGDFSEARNQLLLAMKLYSDPFPTSKHMVRFRDIGASIRQILALFVVPNRYIAIDSGAIGSCYEYIAMTLNRLYTLFTELKETKNATLAAKLALGYALRTNSNFRIICVSYGNLIATYRQKKNYSMCSKLENRALDLCHRKRGKLDVTQIQAICYLYTNIFQFYVEYGKKTESLEFGLSVMHMMTNFIDLNTRQILVIWMLKLLLSDLRIHDMVAIMREFFYMADYYDLSSETWYYHYAMVILLDTGYSVETYATCERFYIKKGDAILRSRTPEAAWNFFATMWLITIRLGAWEKSLLWEDKIKKIIKANFKRHEYTIMVLVRLVEGLLVTLVKEVDNRNVRKILVLQKSAKVLLEEMCSACKYAPIYKSRYYILLAYQQYIKGHVSSAFKALNKASEEAMTYGHEAMKIWAEHTRSHWKGTLHRKYVNFWAEHTDSDTMLDYRDYDPEREKIIPYTLPLPREIVNEFPKEMRQIT